MKRSCYALMLLLWMFSITTSAQEVVEQEQVEKEKIKEIKLSGNYVFATAVTEDDLTEAQQNSMDLLRANVNAIFAERFHMEKEDVEEIWDVIEDKCQNVTIKKGDLFRVFSYILKDYLFPGKKNKKNKSEPLVDADKSEDPIQPEDLEKVSEAVVNETLPQDAQDRIMAFVPAGEMPVEVDSLPGDTLLADLSQEIVEAKEEEVIQAEKPIVARISKPKENSPVGKVEEEPAVVAPKLDPVVEELLLVQTFKDLIAILDQRKEEGILMYGRIKTMLSPEKCYLAIFKDGEMITILDKGMKDRMNLKTYAQDSLNNYKGHGAIWFQLFK